jgi:hypothetical protein
MALSNDVVTFDPQLFLDKFLTSSSYLSYIEIDFNDMIESFILSQKEGFVINSTVLNLRQNLLLTDQTIALLLKSFQGISSLDLSFCSSLTDHAMIVLTKSPSIRCLRSLSVSHCQLLTDCAIKTLCLSAAQLTLLDVSGCHKLTDAAILFISRYLSVR